MLRLSDIIWVIHSKESMSVLFDLSQFNVRLRRSTPTQHVENVQIEQPNAKYAENCVTLLNAIRPFENLISRIILKCNALLSLNRLQNRLNRTSENGTLKKFAFSNYYSRISSSKNHYFLTDLRFLGIVVIFLCIRINFKLLHWLKGRLTDNLNG